MSHLPKSLILSNLLITLANNLLLGLLLVTFDPNTPRLPLNDAYCWGFSFYTWRVRRFNKPALSIPDQVDLLRQRGLIIPDQARAEHYLKNISYYRFSAYTLPFQVDALHRFGRGVTFDQVLEIYIFDRALRVHLFDAIERIEVALRAATIQQMSVAHGSHWHEERRHYRAQYIYEEIQAEIAKICEPARRKEVFMEHYLRTYNSPALPPCWMCFETLTMGTLSKLYRTLRVTEDRSAIANKFLLPEHVFGSWMHAISYIRNICAHHSRLWNRELAIAPVYLHQRVENKGPWINTPYPPNSRMYYALCCIAYLMQRINPKGTFTQRTKLLLDSYKGVPLTSMGFQAGWEQQPLWEH